MRELLRQPVALLCIATVGGGSAAGSTTENTPPSITGRVATRRNRGPGPSAPYAEAENKSVGRRKRPRGPGERLSPELLARVTHRTGKPDRQFMNAVRLVQFDGLFGDEVGAYADRSGAG